MAGGGALSLLGLVLNRGEFASAWLTAFMFFLSLCMGALFLVMVHHLFDAAWSVPIRRICENIANLAIPWLVVLFIPIGILRLAIYPWMSINPHADHALEAKQPLFTVPMFFVVSALCFLIWWWLARGLRSWSIRQDHEGGSLPTYKMRFYSALGIFLYAVSVTLAVVMWMMGMQHQWFSTMYGVYFFSGSVWMTLGTVYVITMIMDRLGILSEVLHPHQYYYLGSLLFAFTVFYAYIHFSQYFIIWNANMPEETFWYIIREQGSWFWVGMVIIFGHFFLPFLALLRIDVKSLFAFMVPVCAWTWLMHFLDLGFNIFPVQHPQGYPLAWFWLHLGCWAFMTGLFAWRFLVETAKYNPYPIKDPRLIEALGLYPDQPSGISTAPRDGGVSENAPPQFGGTSR